VLVRADEACDLVVDSDGATNVAAAWALAARSKRSLLYMPLRYNAERAASYVPAGEPMDLVLLHHTAQFQLTKWSQLQQRIKQGSPHTVTNIKVEYLTDDEIDWAGHYTGEFHDQLRSWRIDNTFFVVGSTRAFRESAVLLHELVDGLAPEPATIAPNLRLVRRAHLD
jgi:hypothetical protein